MTDVHEPGVRSYNMSRIGGKNTKPELLIRSFLHSQGFRYRLHDKRLPGKPDIVLPKYKTVIFINGCFWHGHEICEYFKVPETRKDWWMQKISATKVRDIKTKAVLESSGWNVIIVWECQLKKGVIDETFSNLLAEIMRNN